MNTIRKELYKELTTSPIIPRKYHHLLSQYYLLYWNTDYFLSHRQGVTLVKDGITYLVIYPEHERIKLRNYSQVKLSFRSAKPEYKLLPYVLVSPVMQKESTR